MLVLPEVLDKLLLYGFIRSSCRESKRVDFRRKFCFILCLVVGDLCRRLRVLYNSISCIIQLFVNYSGQEIIWLR